MRWLYHPLLLLLARSTDTELARQVEYLKAENTILRKRLPKRLVLSQDEKRLLVKLGQAVGAGIQALLTAVSYQTFRRWVNLLDPPPPGTHPNKPKSKPGRRRTPDEIRQLVLRLARENAGWGYTRILGELKKLGIKTSRTNVVNILRSQEIDPKTDSTKGTWGEFLTAHAESLWQCDFFSKHIVTLEGVRQCFALAFVHVASRRVFVSPCTFKPDGDWMVQQAHAFVDYAKAQALPAKIVVRDRDGKYVKAFEDALAAGGITTQQVQFCSPNMNAYVERFVQSIQQECLDKFIAFGREHFDLLNQEYVQHYHRERPHQAKANRPLVFNETAATHGDVIVHKRLGGVLRHYSRAVIAA